MERARLSAPHHSSALVSRILQVALGLFVTTSDLPELPPSHELLSFDCTFESPCRWTSVGESMDRWRVAKGEPDALLWLAATGTMQVPKEPFILIEQRGMKVDSLMTDEIKCQRGTANLVFTYWAIGSADLEICLTNTQGMKFNCTGMLQSAVMPGKVSLKVPQIQHPFRIMISPNGLPGVIAIDDIKYDATICPPEGAVLVTTTTDLPMPKALKTIPPLVIPWTLPTVTPRPPKWITTTTTENPITTTPEEPITMWTSTTTKKPSVRPFTLPPTTTDVPFELMIFGNKTTPLFDQRTGLILNDTSKLLCDFGDEFDCQWGAEAGRWAIIKDGAIPNLDELIKGVLPPTFPAALVLQGQAMLTSDPFRCQTGAGKLLFRYWTNADVILQACALGYGIDSRRIECVEKSERQTNADKSLAVFDLKKPIPEPFTLNIVPEFAKGSKDGFLIIDEIAYMGECLPRRPSTRTTTTTTENPRTTTEEEEEVEESTTEEVDEWETSTVPVYLTTTTKKPHTTTRVYPTRTATPPNRRTTTTTQAPDSGEVETVDSGEIVETTTKRKSFTLKFTTTPSSRISTTEEPRVDYCALLNCNFDENACNYLNHGLTKVPWTLRNRGYGYPLTGQTDIRPTQSNGQFVSAILGAGDFAILESPKFNMTTSLNVLLFQYYRPTHASTIRLCLGSRYTKPLRTMASFTQCPQILRSLTSKNAYRWNTVHVQLPPGTSNFYLVAHNSEKAEGRSAIAIDNIRVAICDPHNFDPEDVNELYDNSLDFLP